MSEPSEVVVGTHSLIWHLVESTELSSRARAILRAADAGHRRVFVPSIVLVEIVYLAERGRVEGDLLRQVIGFLADPARSYRLVALDEPVVRALLRVPRAAVPDMPDRIVTATALHLALPLISRDERIRAAGVVPIVW